jgi:hypothetical protein
MTEEFRVIEACPMYEVSNYGKVRRLGSAKVRRSYTRDGYHYLSLRQGDGRLRNWQVHRLVALAFLGEPPSPKHEVAHWDGNPSNNFVGNLRWATRAENVADAIRHGTFNPPRDLRNRRCRLSPDDVRAIRARAANGEPRPRLAAEYNVKLPTICNIVNRRSRKHVD